MNNFVTILKRINRKKWKTPDGPDDFKTMYDNLWSMFGADEYLRRKMKKLGYDISKDDPIPPELFAWTTSIKNAFYNSAEHYGITSAHMKCDKKEWNYWILHNEPVTIDIKPKKRRSLSNEIAPAWHYIPMHWYTISS